jgi:hypothetical protein
VNYQTSSDPAWILAVLSSCRSCSRGYPLAFLTHELVVTSGEIQVLFDFCKRFNIKTELANWYLSSYWER